VTHVGKLYNILAYETAHRISKELEGNVREVWIRIVSQIGKPIDQPQAAAAQIILQSGAKLAKVKPEVESILDEDLGNIEKLTDKIVAGKCRIF